MKNKNFVIFSILLVVGFLAGFGTHYFISDSEKPIHETREKGYEFISPLIDCQDEREFKGNAFTRSLKGEITDFVKNQKKQEISVFFRDLKNGPLISINPKLKFNPASLTKIPLMMAYYKRAELKPSVLSKILIYYSHPGDYEVSFAPSEKLIYGTSYSIDELIFRMIAYSDNGARSLLVKDIMENAGKDDNAVGVNGYEHIFKTLLLSDPNSERAMMSAKEVASLFRVLYNSTYLDRKYSEKALKVLSKTDFDFGFKRNYNPQNKIAHKFGENLIGSSRELHECGIIYQPSQTYILCVMTRGKSTQAQANSISKIYQIVEKQMQKL